MLCIKYKQKYKLIIFGISESHSRLVNLESNDKNLYNLVSESTKYFVGRRYSICS